MGAQAINVLVTVIYFGTSVPTMLLNLAAIQAVEYTTMEGVKEFYIRYECALQQHSIRNTDESANVLEQMHQIVDSEIQQRTSLQGIPLSQLSMAHKLGHRCSEVEEC